MASLFVAVTKSTQSNGDKFEWMALRFDRHGFPSHSSKYKNLVIIQPNFSMIQIIKLLSPNIFSMSDAGMSLVDIASSSAGSKESDVK